MREVRLFLNLTEFCNERKPFAWMIHAKAYKITMTTMTKSVSKVKRVSVRVSVHAVLAWSLSFGNVGSQSISM